jgi:D-cysteine desulfhydrase family pyridoxal phosphate-dependent enzyme
LEFSASDIQTACNRFPRAVFAHLDTPIEPLPRLGAELGLDLHVKRDDCTGLAFGGNKARQLEYYFGEATSQRADTVLITGAVQSNYVRSAAAAAAKLGLDIHVQLEQRVAGVDALYNSSGNVLLDDILGATRSSYPEGEDEEGADAALEALAARWRAEGRNCYIIPLSKNEKPLGAVGYVQAAMEIAETRRQFDALVVGSGSGLTHAGLLFGLKAIGYPARVYGVCVRRKAALQEARVTSICKALGRLLNLSCSVKKSDILVCDEALGPGYGLMNPETMKAISSTARLEGLLLDPVYTAKVMSGLILLAESGELKRGERVLFIHTGGTPALFAYGTQLSNFFAQLGSEFRHYPKHASDEKTRA